MIFLLICLKFSDIPCGLAFHDLHISHLYKIAKAGSASLSSSLSMTFRFLIFNNLLLMVSTASAVSALSVQNSINQILGAFLAGFGITVLLLSSTIYVDVDREGAHNLFREAARNALIVGIIVAIPSFIFAPQLVSIYIDPATDTGELAIICFRCYVVSMPLYSVSRTFMYYF
ncbi:MAG: hypothetical protein HUJ63_05685, partial [Enterococcus sp.]|nr:hypothetical protein [Enterococcus sp.]